MSQLPSFIGVPGLSRGFASSFRTQTTCKTLFRPVPPVFCRRVTTTANIPKDAILKQTNHAGVPKETTDRILNKASSAIRDWSAVTTEFLTPPEAEALSKALADVADLRVERWGGFASAERTVLVAARADLADAVEEGTLHELCPEDLTALQITGNFLFEKNISHPDFLGSVLGCGIGISRQKVGDIIVLGDRGAQVIVSSDVVDFLTGALTQVRTVSVRVERIEFSDLQVRPPSVKEMTVHEASMRLDAVASAGFGMSRSKLVDLVKSGACQRNYQLITHPAKAVKSGDIISVRGRGKLEIGETSLTAKKRFRIQIKRFV